MGTTTPNTTGRYLSLLTLLDVADSSELLAAVQAHRQASERVERPQFTARALLRAYLFKRAFRIRHKTRLVGRLRTDRGLRYACDFGENVPSARTLGRFIARIEEFPLLLAVCLDRVAALLAAHLSPSSVLAQPQHKETAPPRLFRGRELERRNEMNPLSPVHSTVAPWPGQDDGDARV